MFTDFSNDYLLDRKVKIFQPLNGYRASTDAILLSAMINNSVKNFKILDVGAGTGAISLCLAERLKNNNPTIRGLELQPDLANLANLSARENGFDFLQYLNLDIRTKISPEILSPCSFDAVISNPPYSDHDMPSPNKSKATAHNHSNFSLSQWLAFCLKMAKPFGKIYLVNRVEALSEICCALNNKAGNINILPIYSKENMPAKRILISAQKDSKTPLRILKPLVIHQADGAYTPEAQKILRDGFCLNDMSFF